MRLESLAGTLGAQADELVFTSGDTESSNTALKGVTRAMVKKGKHIIVSKIEDYPVLNSAKALERDGFKVTYLGVDEEGLLDIDSLQSNITNETTLVSIQHANQEIGTVQDIKAIADICHDKKVYYHADATHTYKRLPIDLLKVPVDLTHHIGTYDTWAEGYRCAIHPDRDPDIQMDGRRFPGR